MKGKPNQERALARLRDSRVNAKAICIKAGVNYSKIIDQLRGKSAAQLPEDELQRLWDAMDILV